MKPEALQAPAAISKPTMRKLRFPASTTCQGIPPIQMKYFQFFTKFSYVLLQPSPILCNSEKVRD